MGGMKLFPRELATLNLMSSVFPIKEIEYKLLTFLDILIILFKRILSIIETYHLF